MTKLNCGSGKDYQEGYLNVDIDPRFKPDVVSDIRDCKFSPSTFTEILCQDMIDHVSYVEGKKLLRRFYEWLKPDGILHIHTPNLSVIGPLAAKGDHEALKWLYSSDGEDTMTYPSNWIKWAYTKKSLTMILEAIGFTILETREDCSGFGLRVLAVKKV